MCYIGSGEQLFYFDNAHQMLTRILGKIEYSGRGLKKKKPVNDSFTGFCCFLLRLSAERKRFELSMQLPTYYLSRVAPSTTRAPLYFVVMGCKDSEEIVVSKSTVKSNAHFSSQRLAEHVYAGAARLFAGENVHHFGDGRFGCDVRAADDAGLLQEFAGLVLALGDAASVALGDVENDDASLDGIANRIQEPRLGGGVACTVGFQDNAS